MDFEDSSEYNIASRRIKQLKKVFSTEEQFLLDYHVHMNDISMYEKIWVKGSFLTTI